MNTKNICIIAPSRQMGGIERALSILSAHFVKRGHKVTYISCRAGNHFYELDSKVVYLEPPFPHTTKPIKKTISYYKTIRFIRHQLKQIKPDTIMVFGDIINPIALIANKNLGYPIYISDQISPKQNLGFFKNFMKKITYRSATGIIAQSQMAADYKTQVFGNNLNMVIIPNSLRDISSYSNVRKKNWVIGVGRLSTEKGFDRLIEAYSKIENHDNWQLILVGDGPERENLQNQVYKLGLSDKVKFLGQRNDVDALLAESKIFVIPSRCEGFPNALCEAMASPLPCISFDSISASDIIENRKSGVVIPDGDIEALAQEITILMDNEVLRNTYAQNAESIRERLDKDRIGDLFLNFILSDKI